LSSLTELAAASAKVLPFSTIRDVGAAEVKELHPTLRKERGFARMTEQVLVRELLSGIWGSISIAAWIFLLIPQLLENYRTGSAEGLSLAFLLTWFVGDITNLTGQ
jgi:hypothetical protein